MSLHQDAHVVAGYMLHAPQHCPWRHISRTITFDVRGQTSAMFCFNPTLFTDLATVCVSRMGYANSGPRTDSNANTLLMAMNTVPSMPFPVGTNLRWITQVVCVRAEVDFIDCMVDVPFSVNFLGFDQNTGTTVQDISNYNEQNRFLLFGQGKTVAYWYPPSVLMTEFSDTYDGVPAVRENGYPWGVSTSYSATNMGRTFGGLHMAILGTVGSNTLVARVRLTYHGYIVGPELNVHGFGSAMIHAPSQRWIDFTMMMENYFMKLRRFFIVSYGQDDDEDGDCAPRYFGPAFLSPFGRGMGYRQPSFVVGLLALMTVGGGVRAVGLPAPGMSAFLDTYLYPWSGHIAIMDVIGLSEAREIAYIMDKAFPVYAVPTYGKRLVEAKVKPILKKKL